MAVSDNAARSGERLALGHALKRTQKRRWLIRRENRRQKMPQLGLFVVVEKQDRAPSGEREPGPYRNPRGKQRPRIHIANRARLRLTPTSAIRPNPIASSAHVLGSGTPVCIA
jgi:hypothetical protein